MRCRKCKTKAIIELRQHNSAFCREHFLDYFREQVRRNVRRGRMFGPDDRILVAVSGGKDSLALWDVLLDLGYRASGFHIELGIGDYSSRSRDVCRAFAEARGLELVEVDLEEEYGMGVTELSQTLRRVPCSGCGQSKRYLFNRVALERGFDVLATGHNLDDEAATLLGNVLHWQVDALGRQAPVLESTHPGLAKKVKPLYTLTEKEMAVYCLLRRIDYVEEECPNALGARSMVYKDVLNRLEQESPGTKTMFLRGFVERAKDELIDRERPELHECSKCGAPTPGEVCGFCRMWETAERKKARVSDTILRKENGVRHLGTGQN